MAKSSADTLKSKISRDVANNFNFNPVVTLDAVDKRTFKNIVSQQYSIFVVFKSDFEEERIILNINSGVA